jgi:hypothetical protein
MSVFIYVNTAKQVGDAEHITRTLRKRGSRKTTLRASPSSTGFGMKEATN